MDQTFLQRALNLVKKTGDRLVIIDPEKGDGLVLLPLNEYESLVASGGQGAVTTHGNQKVVPEERPSESLAVPFHTSVMEPSAPSAPPVRPAPFNSAAEAPFLDGGLELEERYYLEPLE